MTYPNREHQVADAAAFRRAARAIDDIAAEIAVLKHKLHTSAGETRLDGDDTQRITGLVRDLTLNLAILGTLRDVREWHAADAEARQ